ncbi:monooxygenase 1 isoform X2 [Zea mays]|uniref:Monooxygenase 1 n=2 Tax=Zea mays TaxID=4577 RepID=A0A1D6HAR4_MAIZE|nr:monooxygenase 1 isoform X2 [Zea mays]AQK71793.1 monooxygenase 1 [Zea mays]|eukprot:XP_020394157.1 monooxygenase 1 isoform X2 [Zea mays]
MAKNIPAGSIRFGCHVVAIQQDPGTHGPILTTVDGGTIRAKVLIGCDGGSSAVARYLGLSPPKAIPRTVLRGFTAYPHGHPFGAEFLRIRGGGEFVVGRLPVTRNLVHFFVTMPNPPTGIMLATKDVSATTTKDFMLEKLRDCCAPEIVQMVQDSDPESLNVVNSIRYRSPWQVALAAFHRGAVTVAGDAMHAMGPFIGQGGSAALEDAVVLARSMSRANAAGGGHGAAVREYVRERRPRVALLSLESFVAGTLLRARSLVGKLACVAVLALLGTRSLRHADFDCGRL